MDDKIYSIRSSSIPLEIRDHIFSHYDTLTEYVKQSGQRELERAKKNYRRNHFKHDTSIILILLISIIMCIQLITTNNIFLQLFAVVFIIAILVYVGFDMFTEEHVRK